MAASHVSRIFAAMWIANLFICHSQLLCFMQTV